MSAKGRTQRVSELVNRFTLPLAAAGLAGGLIAWLSGLHDTAALTWAATTAVALLPLTHAVIQSLFRGKAGVDVIALLAMAGALALHEYLAGAVIALMFSGGRALESFGESRARRELSALLQRAPRSVHRWTQGAVTPARSNRSNWVTFC